MYVGQLCTLDLVGCKFSGNTAISTTDAPATLSGDVLTKGTVNINGRCPVGFSGAAGAELETYIDGDGTITGEIKSHSCVACTR